MPRPTKVFSRQRASAALAWKRGEKQEAYKLWEGAAKGLKEHYAKKHNKKRKAIEEAAAAEAKAAKTE